MFFMTMLRADLLALYARTCVYELSAIDAAMDEDPEKMRVGGS